MQITDTIADMLTRIRNASSAKHDSVDIPASNMKKAIAQILVDEGYIKGYKVEDNLIMEVDTTGRRSVRFRPISAVETKAAMEQLGADKGIYVPTPARSLRRKMRKAGFPEEADRPEIGDAASGGLRRDGRASRAGGCRGAPPGTLSPAPHPRPAAGRVT